MAPSWASGSQSPGTADPRQTEDLLARVKADLLPHQLEFVNDTSIASLACVVGLAVERRRRFAPRLSRWPLPIRGTPLPCLSPRLSCCGTSGSSLLMTFLEEYEIPFTYRASPLPEYILHLPEADTTISAGPPKLGHASGARTSPPVWRMRSTRQTVDIGAKAVQMMLARLRSGNIRQLAMASTPEGFRMMHQLFVEDANQGERRLIRPRPWTTRTCLTGSFSPCRSYTHPNSLQRT